MSMRCYLLLLNRTCIEDGVATILSDVLNHKTDQALRVLKREREKVKARLDNSPEHFFESDVGLAIDVLEGRIKRAFVNESIPVITEPHAAWKQNVSTLVKRGLSVALCTQIPAGEYSPVIAFWLRYSALILEASPTARDALDSDDPNLLERFGAGIFKDPESLVKRDTCQKIVAEISGLIEALPTVAETEETKQSIRHLYAILREAESNSEAVLLKGFF